MGRYTVAARDAPAVEIEAPNWLVALGTAVHRLGLDDALSRLAVEVMPNGVVLARVGPNSRPVVVEPEGRSPAEDEAFLSSEQPFSMEGEPSTTSPRARLATPSRAPGEVAVLASRALAAALAAAPSRFGAVLIADGASLQFVAVHGGRGAALHGARVPFPAGLAGYALAHRRSVVVVDVSRDPRHGRDHAERVGVQASTILCVPALDASGAAVGVIELINPIDGGRFSRSAWRRTRVAAARFAAAL